MLSLARQAAGLKTVPRTGWLDRGIDPRRVESVADHSLGVALLAWACAVERQAQGAALDPIRVVMLALIHDLAEAETGDSPPYDPAALPAAFDRERRRAFLDRRHVRANASQAAKRADEDAAMRRLLDALPAGVRAELEGYWEELNQGTSAEARFVKQIDRLETFLQSRVYQHADPGLPVDSFRREVMETIDDPLLTAIRDAALENDISR
jgi:putative hydrolase of HD superfamily